MLSYSGLRRRGKSLAPHDSSALLNQLRAEEAMRGKELRKQMLQEKKAAQEAYVNELIDWEDTLLTEPIKTQMRSMWEVTRHPVQNNCHCTVNLRVVVMIMINR